MAAPRTQTKTAGGARLALVAAAGLVLAVLVVAAIVGARSGEDDFPAGSPEATVQTYLRAIRDNRRSDAFDTFTDSLRARCASVVGGDFFLPPLTRAELAERSIGTDRATVVVVVTEGQGGGLFDPGSASSRQSIELARTEAGWRISEPPWPLFACGAKVGP